MLNYNSLCLFYYIVPCSIKKCTDTPTTISNSNNSTSSTTHQTTITTTITTTTPISICPEGWISGVDYCYKNITAYSPGFKSLIGVTNDLVALTVEKTIKILNVTNGQELRTLSGHLGNVNSLVLLNTGDLASCSDDNTIKVWRIADGLELKSFGGHLNSISQIVLLADGRIASCGRSDPEIKIWSPYSESQLNQTIKTNESDMTQLAVLSETHLAIGYDSGLIRLINITDGTEMTVLNRHNGSILSLLNLPNGYFVSGSADTTINVWGNLDGLFKMSISGHSSGVNVLVVLQGLYLISSGSSESSIKLWSLNDGSYLCEVTENIHGVNAIAVLDGYLIVFGLADGSVFTGYLLS